MKQSADAVLDLMVSSDNLPTLKVARELERIALEDEFFQSRRLYPNVDFYSGIILDADWLPDLNVHSDLCAVPNRRLDFAMEGNDRGSDPEDRQAQAEIHGQSGTNIHAPVRTLTKVRLPDWQPAAAPPPGNAGIQILRSEPFSFGLAASSGLARDDGKPSSKGSRRLISKGLRPRLSLA